MSFGAAKAIAYHMGRDFEVIILDLTDVPMMGVTASLTIETEVRAAHRREHCEILIAGAKGQVKDRLWKFQVQNALPAGHFLPSRYYALKLATTFLAETDADGMLLVAASPAQHPVGRFEKNNGDSKLSLTIKGSP